MSQLDELPSTSLLHCAARKGHLEDLEIHLIKAARLSRALWVALQNEDLCEDDRSRLALAELASEVADHASAAEFVFFKTPAKNLTSDIAVSEMGK